MSAEHMVETNIINGAIMVLKNECSNHELCENCPMSKVISEGYVKCRLHYDPCKWELLKEQKNG